MGKGHASLLFFGNKDLRGTFTHLFFLALCLWNQLQVSVTLDLCSTEGKFVSAVRHRNGARKIQWEGRKKREKIISRLRLLHTSAFSIVMNPLRVETLCSSEPPLCLPGRPTSSLGSTSCSTAARLHFRVNDAKFLLWSWTPSNSHWLRAQYFSAMEKKNEERVLSL